MTFQNNSERAAHLFYSEGCGSRATASYVARAMVDDGLIAPDLPEPRTFPNGEREWYTTDGWVSLDTDGKITVVYDKRDEDDLAAGSEIEPGERVFTEVSEAHDLALALLAAVTYTKKESDHDHEH